MPPDEPALLRFAADWREEQVGEIRQGGKLRIEYETARIEQAFESPGGSTPSRIDAHVVFYPGGREIVSQVDEAVELTVPRDASEIHVWFQALERDRSTVWDSRYGENYRFSVSAGPGTSSGT